MLTKRLLALGTGVLAAGAAALAFASPANAATNGAWYRVSGTDGWLTVQSQPATGHQDGWSIREGGSVYVLCQVNNGGTDVGDGGYFSWQYSRTWDEIVLPDSTIGWVYDHFITTPPQGADGYSPGVQHCY
jgi:hypothetical protein